MLCGDFNAFLFNDGYNDLIGTLKGKPDQRVTNPSKTYATGLYDLADFIAVQNKYSYVHDGSMQVLDHILVSNALAGFASPVVDIVHANAEFAAQTSDHDPDIARLTLPKAGDVDGDGDVDRADVDAITAARNTNANGPYDPRNMNGDARIDVTDARLAVSACTRPGCAP